MTSGRARRSSWRSCPRVAGGRAAGRARRQRGARARADLAEARQRAPASAAVTPAPPAARTCPRADRRAARRGRAASRHEPAQPAHAARAGSPPSRPSPPTRSGTRCAPASDQRDVVGEPPRRERRRSAPGNATASAAARPRRVYATSTSLQPAFGGDPPQIDFEQRGAVRGIVAFLERGEASLHERASTGSARSTGSAS